MLDAAIAAEGRGEPAGLQVGIMVEVPATALKTAAFAPYVDFLSIGTNDLTQYALAAERGNHAVAALGDPYDPGVLRLVQSVCDRAGSALVAVCGELAADERAATLLVGLGVRELSVVPVVGAVRQAGGPLPGQRPRRGRCRSARSRLRRAGRRAGRARRARSEAARVGPLAIPAGGVCCGRAASVGVPCERTSIVARYVYDFSEGDKDQKDLLGGKGANLAEMTRLGLPVPPGFTVTTEACRRYLRARRGAGRAAGPGDRGAAPAGGRGRAPARRRRTTRCWSACGPGRSSRCPG